MRILHVIAAFGLFGSTASAEDHAAERAAALEVVDAFFVALMNRDGDGWRALYADEAGGAVAAREEGETWALRRNTLMEAAERLPEGASKIEEYYWDPTVLIRPSLAVVWAPYEFLSGGARTHCGVDVFTLVKASADAPWRIAELAYSVEPNACEALKPPGVAVRPAVE